MSDYLPQEVWRDIFTRLPAKSILKMMSVCKEFRNLISDQAFIGAHLSRSEDTHKILINFNETGRSQKNHHQLLMLNDGDEKLDRKKGEEIKCPFETFNWIIGSLNGIVCLCKECHVADEIILWNPSLRKWIELPKPPANGRYPNCYTVLGFGFDPSTNDYKVVRLEYLKNNYEVQPRIDLFTLSSRSWRTISNNLDSTRAPIPQRYDRSGASFRIDENIWPQAYVNGAVHWISYDPHKTNPVNKIIFFGMINEQFGNIMLPVDIEMEMGYRLSLAVCKNLLSVSQYEENSRGGRYSIWVLDKYGQVNSWIKLYSIDLQGKLSKMIEFRKDGHVIMVTKEGKLVTYDPNTQRTRNVGISGVVQSFSIVDYTDSLVLLDQKGAVSSS